MIVGVSLLFRLQLYELVERKVQGDGNCQVSPCNLNMFILSSTSRQIKWHALYMLVLATSILPGHCHS